MNSRHSGVTEFLTAALERAMKSRVLLCSLLLVSTAVAAQVARVRSSPIVLNPDTTLRTGKFDATVDSGVGGAVVSLAELAIPARARKEFDKSNELLRKQRFIDALHELNKAVKMYPHFASAYNNMGVIYAWLGDTDCERLALQTAIEMNNTFELAYVNWARLNIASADYKDADAALHKASSLDASDTTPLVLLAYSALAQGNAQEALTLSHKAHTQGGLHAFAHRVAARVFEQRNQLADAVAELKLCLQEQPAGPGVDAARNELHIVESLFH